MCRITFEFSGHDRVEKFRPMKTGNGMSWACLETTNICDFHCVYCYTSSGMRKNPGLSTKVFLGVIDQFADLGIRQISFVGGEPLMRSDIFQLIEYAHTKGMISHVCSNGYYINKDVARKLWNSGATQVQLNVDHINRKEHDKIRGKTGSFEKALKAIEYLKHAGISVVVASLFIKQNSKVITKVLESSRDLGVQGYRIWYPVAAGYALENYHIIAPNPFDYINLIKSIFKKSDEYGIERITTIDPLLFSLKHYAPRNTWFIGCPSGYHFLTVAFDGEVLPCSGLRQISAGNILQEKLEVLIDSAAFEFFREVTPSKECTTCDFTLKCRGGCVSFRDKVLESKDYRCPLGKHSFLNSIRRRSFR